MNCTTFSFSCNLYKIEDIIIIDAKLKRKLTILSTSKSVRDIHVVTKVAKNINVAKAMPMCVMQNLTLSL